MKDHNNSCPDRVNYSLKLEKIEASWGLPIVNHHPEMDQVNLSLEEAWVQAVLLVLVVAVEEWAVVQA